MINSKPKSAVFFERMGCDSAALKQFAIRNALNAPLPLTQWASLRDATRTPRSANAITFCNGEKFVGTETVPKTPGDLTPTQNVLPIEAGELNPQILVIKSDVGTDYWQLPIADKKLAIATRLLSPKADFLRSNVTFRGNTPLSKEFQGESR